jgi:hypothetical protein
VGLKIGKFFGSVGRSILKTPARVLGPIVRPIPIVGPVLGSTFKTAASFATQPSSKSVAPFSLASDQGNVFEVRDPRRLKPKPRPPGGGRLGGLAEKIQKGMELMQQVPGISGIFGSGGGSAREHCAMIRQMIAMHLGRMHAPRMRDIKKSVKFLGLEASAMNLGVSVSDLAGLVLFCPVRKRALVKRTDLRACRRVVSSMHRLNSLVGSLGVGRSVRRKTGRGRCIRCKSNPCRCAA